MMNNNEYERRNNRNFNATIRDWPSNISDSSGQMDGVNLFPNYLAANSRKFSEGASSRRNVNLESYGNKEYPVQQQYQNYQYNYNTRNMNNQYREPPSEYMDYHQSNRRLYDAVNHRLNQDYHGRIMPKIGATTDEKEAGYGEVVMCQYNATHIYDRRFIHSHEERCHDQFICDPEASLS